MEKISGTGTTKHILSGDKIDSIVVAADAKAELDLNGHKLTAKDDSDTIKVNEGGQLTIKSAAAGGELAGTTKKIIDNAGSVTMENTANVELSGLQIENAIVNSGAGTMTVKNFTMDGDIQSNATVSTRFLIVNNGTSMNLNGGTIDGAKIATDPATEGIGGVFLNLKGEATLTEMTIQNVTAWRDSILNNKKNATIIINSGTYKYGTGELKTTVPKEEDQDYASHAYDDDWLCVFTNEGNATINDGEFTRVGGYDGFAVAISNGRSAEDNSKLVVKGGTFTSDSKYTIMNGYPSVNTSADLDIQGGTITSKSTSFPVGNYDNGNGSTTATASGGTYKVLSSNQKKGPFNFNCAAGYSCEQSSTEGEYKVWTVTATRN